MDASLLAGNGTMMGVAYPYSIADNIGSRFMQATSNQAERVRLFFEKYHGNGQWIETGAFIDVMPFSTLSNDLLAVSASLDTMRQTAGTSLEGQLAGLIQSGDVPKAVLKVVHYNK